MEYDREKEGKNLLFENQSIQTIYQLSVVECSTLSASANIGDFIHTCSQNT